MSRLIDRAELFNRLANVTDISEVFAVIQEMPAALQDSGERTEFVTGAVRDLHEGKGRFDLLPWAAIWEVARHCENGAKKYGEHNVDKGIPVHSLFDSAVRHAMKWWMRQEDEPHLVAACWNLLWALNMMLEKPAMDDRPNTDLEEAFRKVIDG